MKDKLMYLSLIIINIVIMFVIIYLYILSIKIINNLLVEMKFQEPMINYNILESTLIGTALLTSFFYFIGKFIIKYKELLKEFYVILKENKSNDNALIIKEKL